MAASNIKQAYWYNFLRSVPRKQLVFTLIFGAIRILLSTAWPYAMYRIIQKNNQGSQVEIAIYILIVVFLFIAAGLATHKQALMNLAIMETFSLNLIERMWVKINNLDWSIFYGKSRVYFYDLFMVDAWRLRLGMLAFLELILVNGLITGVLILFIAFISLPMFVLCISGIAIMALVQLLSNVRIRAFVKNFHDAWRKQHHWIARVIDQFNLIKMGRAYLESEKANTINTKLFLNSNGALLTALSKWRTINQAVGNMVRLIIFGTGFYWVHVNYVPLPALMLVLLLISIVQNNMSQLPGAVNNFIEGIESQKSIQDFFNLPEEKDAEILRDIEFKSVEAISIKAMSFFYGEKQVINNLDIELEKGKIYLWRGTNGSGKTTLAHVLLGLLEPKSGELKINGEITDWKFLKNLRKRFAFVNQDSPLFTGTVRENLFFGHPEEENAFLKMKNNWLNTLMPNSKQPENLMVGERGEGLSGGEIRRLVLIREWIRPADLFILDEPLNHLDDFAIDEIKREIVNLKAEAIVIIISHQKGFETIADEIVQF